MSAAAALRLITSRLSALPRRVHNNHARHSARTFSSSSSSHATTPPRRSLSLSARHAEPEPSLVPAGPPTSQLPFAELVARTSAFLVDYYEAPTASPVVAAQLLAALRQLDVGGQQRLLKERLEGELDELVSEGKRRQRRLGDDRPLDKDDDKHDSDDHHDHADDVLRIARHDDDDDGTLDHRIIARPPLPPPPHLHDMDFHPDSDAPSHKPAATAAAGAGGGAARGKFDVGYSTDQLLVDSLPTLKEEEAVQVGRRDVMKLMATRE